MHSPSAVELQNFDLSGVGFGNDDRWETDTDTRTVDDNNFDVDDDIDEEGEDEVEYEEDINNDNNNEAYIRKIKRMSRNKFREYLIANFETRFQKKQLTWPSRLQVNLQNNDLE